MLTMATTDMKILVVHLFVVSFYVFTRTDGINIYGSRGGS